jgi:hypothetical protein
MRHLIFVVLVACGGSSGGASGNATVTFGGSAAALPDVQGQSR